jgi:hypothetical protein
MKFTQWKWTLAKWVALKELINPKPQYQRGPVWSPKQDRLLIDSIIQGFDIPKIYLRKTNGSFEYEIADGQQRLSAIWRFINNEYSLGALSSPFKRLSNKSFEELDVEVQKLIKSYILVASVSEDTSNDQIRELFRRLQQGTRLTPPEIRNSLPSCLGDVIRTMALTHSFFKKAKYGTNRFQADDLLAHAFCLSISQTTARLKAPDLYNLYQEYAKEVPLTSTKKVNLALNYLSAMLDSHKNCLRTKWGFVDIVNLYLTTTGLPAPSILASRFMSFEKERLKHTSDTSTLFDKDGNCTDLLILRYIEAFKLESGEPIQILDRLEILKKKLLLS